MMVEIPPKLITKLARIVARNLFEILLSEMQPFVISITPCKKQDSVCGKKLKTGAKLSMITKKIVMIQPTDKIEIVESKTMSEISKFCFRKSIFCKFSLFFTFKLRKIMPFIIALRM